MKVSALRRSSMACRSRQVAGMLRRSLRHALVVLIAIAFAAQGFVAQTHIHGITHKTLTELSPDQAALGHAKGKLPSLPDGKDCPLCCLAAFVGSCVVPLAALALPADISALLPVPEPVLFAHIKAGSHSWQVRAPPR